MTTRIILPAVLGLSLSTALAGTAFAQSYNAPAGIPSVTAPGGLEGRAAAPNLIEAQDGTRGFVARGYEDGSLVTGSVLRPRDEAGRARR